MKNLLFLPMFLTLLSIPLAAEEMKHNYVGVEGEFANSPAADGYQSRVKLLGVLGLKPSIGLEVAMAYGDQINKHPWESDGRRQFTLGVGIRNVHKIAGRFRFYYTLSGGTIYRPANSGFFFQPKIGTLISLSKRVDLNLNTFWTIPIAKAEGILEQPFSVGLNFQL